MPRNRGYADRKVAQESLGAKSLIKQYNPSNPVNDNPSTTVHLLVKKLNKFIR
ncbi:MAG: hypothetical protein RMY16_24170 [Nostoc sp. DedQUE12b]|uniref:hypothetical protein n=1 Tax=Nostoc sp. DedQUE12b TaxID=3075398 RepID=UPI002AD46CF3|nr:hypothetical protein [Nostoc sp. DedQUE12b]MDZ8088626.1 hypothetical protein [Nostoc sp. DedQUE12b]